MSPLIDNDKLFSLYTGTPTSYDAVSVETIWSERTQKIAH